MFNADQKKLSSPLYCGSCPSGCPALLRFPSTPSFRTFRLFQGLTKLDHTEGCHAFKSLSEKETNRIANQKANVCVNQQCLTKVDKKET